MIVRSHGLVSVKNLTTCFRGIPLLAQVMRHFIPKPEATTSPMVFIHRQTVLRPLKMKTIQPKSAAFSPATKHEAPVNQGETLPAAAAMLSATASPAPGERMDWAVVAEEDSSFFVPERCSALDDF